MNVAILDDALSYFYERRNYEYSYDFYSFEREYFKDNVHLFSPQTLLNKLAKDGYLAIDETDEAFYNNAPITREKKLRITYDGIIFHKSGGYGEHAKRIFADREFTKIKMDLELQQIQSTILTNKLQRWSFWASLITASVALAVSVISLFKDDTNVIKPSIVLQDTVLKSEHQDTLQLKIQLYQRNDTLR